MAAEITFALPLTCLILLWQFLVFCDDHEKQVQTIFFGEGGKKKRPEEDWDILCICNI
jgi:hypothetical protein